MIQQLSALGKKLREEKAKKSIVHDALKSEPFAIDLNITKEGHFHSFVLFDKQTTVVEALLSKKGKARLLLDKVEELLGIGKDEKKHQLFLNKLEEYKDVKELEPVFKFYNENKNKGHVKALECFFENIPEKEQMNNIAFRIIDEEIRIHEKESVYDAIIEKYLNWEHSEMEKNQTQCSLCGKSKHPVLDLPHGLMKRVPEGQSAGCALISYNVNAFESYNQKGNLNSRICTNCAKTYTEGLNWLLQNGQSQKNKNGKDYFNFSNRKNLSSDTAIVFWTKENKNVNELDLLNNKHEIDLLNPFQNKSSGSKYQAEAADIKQLFKSISSGQTGAVSNVDTDRFYAIILSGAAARIAIRSWIEIAMNQMRSNIEKWLNDISIIKYDKPVFKKTFNPIQNLSFSCAVHRKDKQGVYLCNYKDPVIGIVSTSLWKAALLNTILPLNILDKVLRRIKTEEGRITDSRAALIKLILNRNNKGGHMLKEELDKKNKSTAYICGRIFSVLESIQRAALGKNVNAGVRERFFSSASTSPSLAFGRLMKLSQNHLSKIKNEEPGLAVFLDKKLQKLFYLVDAFPVIFTMEEQGQFAIGYYHQKHENFKKAEQKAEYKAMVEEEEGEKNE